MIDPFRQQDRDKLARVAKRDYDRLEPLRRLVRTLVGEIGGSSLDSSQAYATYINLLNQFVEERVLTLAANCPEVNLRPTRPELKWFAVQFEQELNALLKEIALGRKNRRAVIEACLGVAVMRVCLRSSVPVEVEYGWEADPGQIYVMNVALDNFVFDMRATEWHQIRYAGDGYRVPFETLRQVFPAEVTDSLRPTSKYRGAYDSQRLENISRGNDCDDDELEPMISLIDMWLPRNKTIYTFATEGMMDFGHLSAPLRAVPWDGREGGVYHILSFLELPENIASVGPAAQVAELSRLANDLLRKQAKRAIELKTNHLYEASAQEGAERLATAHDGQIINVNDLTAIRSITTGGIDGGLQALEHDVINWFDRMTGNLSAKLGLGPQADTASQEEHIQANVSIQTAQMQYRVAEFVKGVVSDLAYLMWKDAYRSNQGAIDIPGAAGYRVPYEWSPDVREGRFEDYEIDIRADTMGHKTPTGRLRSILGFVNQVIAPFMPLIQQQGGQLKTQTLLEMGADLMNEPRLTELVEFVGPQQAMMQGQQPPGMRASGGTPREYIHRNVSNGPNAQGQATVARQAWMNMADATKGGSNGGQGNGGY